MHRIAFLTLIFSVSLIGQPKQWKENQVLPTMEEILSHHVEYKKMAPDLLARTSKIFFQSLDGQKIYLLQEEIDSFCNLSKSDWAKVADNFSKGDLSFFENLNHLLEKVILRARILREELQKELIFQSNIDEMAQETYIGYAKNFSQLKIRIRKQILDFMYHQKQTHPDKTWNIETRKKVFSFLEKKIRRYEDRYLDSSRQEHYFTLNLLKALSKSLDAHTTFFSDEEAMQMRVSLEKELYGYGLMCQESLDGVRIAGVVKNSPADQSNKVAPGDYLMEIDGEKVELMTFEEVMGLLQSNNKVSLGCRRIVDGQSLHYHVSLRAEKIVLDDERLQWEVQPLGEGAILKLTLPSFYEGEKESGCEADIRKALREVKKNYNILGIVLDLRENSGGFLQQAVKVAGLFVSNGVIVISKYSGGEIRYLRQIDGRVYHTGPLVILTSKASASAAEIVAQALQDYGSALVIGDERTYGKGTIQYQTVTSPDSKAFYKVTIGRYYTVSGRSTQIEGVQADIVVPTKYAGYRIGERYLDYPLQSDYVASAYVDPLTDVEGKAKNWFQKNYLPNVQKKEVRWRKMLPALQKNSTRRLESDPDFRLFMQKQVKSDESPTQQSNWGAEDLPMKEAVQILSDMIYLQN